MTVTPLHAWRLAGCTADCYPRSHDPSSHEAFGRLLERQEQINPIVKTGALVIDLDLRTVTVHGETVALSPREWQLLSYYAERPGRWCTSPEIVRAIWQFAHPHIANTLRRCLRQKLGAASSLIETQGRGQGQQWTRLAMVEPT